MSFGKMEIKPIGFDRSLGDSEIRRAFIETIKGLAYELTQHEFGKGNTSSAHLRWMCSECLDNIKTMPIDKMGRWVGFIQGVMASNGVLDVDKERDRTRFLFSAAYEVTEKCKKYITVVSPTTGIKTSYELNEDGTFTIPFAT